MRMTLILFFIVKKLEAQIQNSFAKAIMGLGLTGFH